MLTCSEDDAEMKLGVQRLRVRGDDGLVALHLLVKQQILHQQIRRQVEAEVGQDGDVGHPLLHTPQLLVTGRVHFFPDSCTSPHVLLDLLQVHTRPLNNGDGHH